MAIFINKVQIKNFRCFKDQSIDLRVPDGETVGSGLNVIVGENGNGKTTLLESINYLTLNRFSAENKLRIQDFNDINACINIKCETSEFKVGMAMPYTGYFNCSGLEFDAKSRDRKEAGKLLSTPFRIKNSFQPVGANYMKSNGDDSGKEIPAYFLPFDNSRIQEDELNIFYFDKNRTRQITTGTYKTTFERICDDFNWKFVKELTPDNTAQLVENVSGEYFKKVSEIAQKGAGDKIANDLAQFFDNEEYKKIGIDLLDLLHPYTNAFFALREENSIQQILTRDLGSGIEMILTLLLLKSIAGESKGSIIYLIDEPELHLHPKAQEKLIQLLLDESKNKQIILTTHSPYFFKSALANNIGVIIPKRNGEGALELTDANASDWGIFPWSPTWGEVNFKAYDMPTIEYHNELYGYLQEITGIHSIPQLDDFLTTKGIARDKHWIRLQNGNPQPPSTITLPSYIRNSIHHPENTHNIAFTESELIDSIETLMHVIEDEQ